MNITKKKLEELTTVAMSLGCFRVTTYGREYRLYCPAHRQAVRDRGMHQTMTAHKFSVFQPYGRFSDAPLLKRDVMEALARHLEDAGINGEPCDDFEKAARS